MKFDLETSIAACVAPRLFISPLSSPLRSFLLSNYQLLSRGWALLIALVASTLQEVGFFLLRNSERCFHRYGFHRHDGHDGDDYHSSSLPSEDPPQ